MAEPLSDLQALEQFVVDNDNLLELEARVGKFNIFDALGVVHQEIRHSNFLAWLLDPAESHGLGPLFLKAVLMDLLRQTPADDRLFSPIRLDGGELTGIEVRREWKHIDLLITCDPATDDEGFVIAIENKVHSSEHSNQLARYKKTVEENRELAKFKKRQFVYLTPEGDEPSEDGWTVYSYADLHRVLQKVCNTSGGQMGDDVRAFLDHYLRLIGSRLMEDTEIAELCREIYKNHRQAIDLIVEHSAQGSPAIDEVDRLIVEHPDWDKRSRGKGSINLQLAEFVNTDRLCRDDGNPWINTYFEWWNRELRWFFHVGPHSDLDLRKRVIEKLREASDDLGIKSSGKITNEWTTIVNLRVYSWKEFEADPENLLTSVQRLLDDRAPMLRQAMNIVGDELRRSGLPA